MSIRQQTQRRSLIGWLGAALLAPSAFPLGARPAAELPSIAVLNFELVDDHHNPATWEATKARLVRATAQLQKELAERGLYRVVDAAPSQALQKELHGQQAFLYNCSDCAQQVGRLLGTDLVMATWVQKVSELILNMNIEIRNVKTNEGVLSRSIDMRSNDDVSWQRGVSYLVRGLAEKRARNPLYGIEPT